MESEAMEEHAMSTKDITYQIDGKTFTGYLADGSGGKTVPGILVCHQGGGLTEHARIQARRAADLGYVAFALDMYGELATSREHAMELLNGLMRDRDLLRKRAHAGIAVLKAQANTDASRLAAIGYCFGGALVIELARSGRELAGVVSMHPGLTYVVNDTRKAHGKVLVCAGANDPFVAPDTRNQFIADMETAGADWQMIVYGGAGHSFTDPSVDAMNVHGFRYHEPTDRRSWAVAKALFEEAFEKP
jgi:dienelactone hydrolase